MSVRFARAALFCVLLAFSVKGNAHETKCAIARYELQALESALRSYRATQGSFPSSERWVDSLKRAGVVAAEQVVADPWGRPFGYALRGDVIELWSLGRDGTRGTEDDQDTRGDYQNRVPCVADRRC